MYIEQWVFWVTAIVFTGVGYYFASNHFVYQDVKRITQNVIDTLNSEGFLYTEFDDRGEEQLVRHPYHDTYLEEEEEDDSGSN